MALKISNSINKAGITAVTLKTANTFVDQDIVVENDVQAGSLNNQPSAGVTYTEDTSSKTVVPAEGSLYLNAGWYNNTKISLGHLIPDDVNLENAGTNNIMEGFEAYDSEGKKLVGTLATVNPTFSGGAVTATANGSVITNPAITVDTTITPVGTSTYGLTSNKPTGTEGTDFVKISNGVQKTSGTVRAKADANRSAVIYDNDATGFISKDGATALNSASATQSTKDITVGATAIVNQENIYAPITEPTITGGTVTAKSGKIVTAPKFNVTLGVSDAATSFGVTETKPSGTDGNNYITFTPGGDGVPSTTNISIEADQAAVVMNQSAGLTSAKENKSVIGSKTGIKLTSSASTTPVADKVAKAKYIPIVSPTFAGGSVSGSTSVSVTEPTVTINQAVTEGAIAFGLTHDKPTSEEGTDFVGITFQVNKTNGAATSRGTAKRSAVTYSNAGGAIPPGENKSALTASSDTNLTTDSKDIVPAITSNLDEIYIPKAEVTTTPGTPSLTHPTAAGSVTLATDGGTFSGALTTQPTSGHYIIITPIVTITAGSVKSTATTVTTAGVVKATTHSVPTGKATAIRVRDNTAASAKRYIPIYDGSYSIS